MAISNKSNVIKRSDKVTPLTQPEVDQNFQEIRNVIDDTTQLESEYHAYVISNDARVDTLTLNIESVDDKVDGLEFSDIAGTATADQVPNLGDLNGSVSDLYAPASTGHIRAGNVYLSDMTGNASNNAGFAHDELSVKSYGRTDSDSDYELAWIDDLPSNARALIMTASYSAQYTDDNSSYKVYASASPGVTYNNDVRALLMEVHAYTAGVDYRGTQTVIIPLGPTQGCRIFKTSTGSAYPAGRRVYFFFRGYITD